MNENPYQAPAEPPNENIDVLSERSVKRSLDIRVPAARKPSPLSDAVVRRSIGVTVVIAILAAPVIAYFIRVDHSLRLFIIVGGVIWFGSSFFLRRRR